VVHIFVIDCPPVAVCLRSTPKKREPTLASHIRDHVEPMAENGDLDCGSSI
jgi:hypothetical protein